MIGAIFDVVMTGLLLGGIYALISVGLSLQYGVARVFNVAHGEFMMLGALSTWSMNQAFGLNPVIAMAVCGPIAFGIGYVLHRTLFKRLRRVSPSIGAFEGSSMLASFGLLFIIQNVANILWGTQTRAFAFMTYPVNIFGALFAANRLVTLAFALAIGIVFYIFLVRTRLGKAIRAAAQDPSTASLMGVNINQVLALGRSRRPPREHVLPDPNDHGPRIHHHHNHRGRSGWHGKYPGQFYRRLCPGSHREHRHQGGAGPLPGFVLSALHAPALDTTHRHNGEVEE
jgi:hypothetical protein